MGRYEDLIAEQPASRYEDLIPTEPAPTVERPMAAETSTALNRGFRAMGGEIVKTIGDVLTGIGTRTDVNTGQQYPAPIIGKPVAVAGQLISKGGQHLLETAQAPEMQRTRYGVGGFLANEVVGGAVPSMVGSLATATALGPAAAIAFIGTAEGASAYQNALRSGDSPRVAMAKMAIVGPVNAYLEKLQIDSIFGRGYKATIGDALASKAWEKMPAKATMWTAAGAQQAVENAIQEMAQGTTPVVADFMLTGKMPDPAQYGKDRLPKVW